MIIKKQVAGQGAKQSKRDRYLQLAVLLQGVRINVQSWKVEAVMDKHLFTRWKKMLLSQLLRGRTRERTV